MTDKVVAAIERHGMLISGERVLIALSGGADSTALLMVLSELGYDVFAVHVNHNLRGDESLSDENFCRRLCERLSIELFVESVDVRAYCEEHKCSTELGARELRYNALYKHSDGVKIATAHTLSDALETAIFNFTRGCGVKGLTSIPPVRGNIIRPLIDCTRSDVEEYLAQKSQDYVTDSTNLLPDCSRNIIRLNVIPELLKINSGLMTSFAGTLASLREADEYIESKALELIGEQTETYDFSQAEDDAVLSRALSIILKRADVEPSFERITAAKKLIRDGGRINIKKGVYLAAHAGRLFFEYQRESEPLEVKITLRENVQFGEKTLSDNKLTSKTLSDNKFTLKTLVVTKISPFDISAFNKKELRWFIDEAKMGEEYTLRHYRGNETIRLPNRGFSSTIKKLLDKDSRLENIVIADGEGAIFVEGIGVSERVCCTEETTSAVKIDIITSEESKK